MSVIIGINPFHDAAASALFFENQEILEYRQYSEDRHSGISHHYGFPWHSLQFAIESAAKHDIDAVSYPWDKDCFLTPPEKYFGFIEETECGPYFRHRLSELLSQMSVQLVTARDFVESLKSAKFPSNVINFDDSVLRKKLIYLYTQYRKCIEVEKRVQTLLPNSILYGIRHHECHASLSAFAERNSQLAVTIDGRGEFQTTGVWDLNASGPKLLKSVNYPKSLGNLYALFAKFLGFDVVSGPGKLMGLAAYGTHTYLDLFQNILDFSDESFEFLFGEEILLSDTEPMALASHFLDEIGPAREHSQPLEQRHKDIAFAVQFTLEKVLTKLFQSLKGEYDFESIFFSGGVALNCVANAKVMESTGIELELLPACSDDGLALASAINVFKTKYVRDSVKILSKPEMNQGSSLTRYQVATGTENDDYDVEAFLVTNGFAFSRYTPEEIAKRIVADEIIGIRVGPYEFGPRALGHCSIIANATKMHNWKKINDQIKFREDFRPFAPMIEREFASQIIENKDIPHLLNPYMLVAPDILPEYVDVLPAVTHVDRSSRIQVIDLIEGSFMAHVLQSLKELNQAPALLNTSLNMAGESIIVDYKDVLRFMKFASLDAVIVGKFLVERDSNKKTLEYVFKDTRNIYDYLNFRSTRYKHYLQTNNLEADYIQFEANHLNAFQKHSERIIPKNAFVAYMHDVSIIKK
jgi:carbamoyltransferase